VKARKGWRLYFDGGAGRSNKQDRLATYGWQLEHDGMLVEYGYGVIGRGPGVTCNVAEWGALQRALEAVCDREFDRLLIHGDSLLVINQLTGYWRTHAEHLRPYRDRCRGLLEGCNWAVWHVPRAQNTGADSLARLAYELV